MDSALLREKKSPVKDRAYSFAVRRLIRHGSITKADVIAVIGCSPVTAGNTIKTIKRHAAFVTQNGQRLCLKSNIQIEDHLEWMSIASDKQLNQAIKNGGLEEFTGLKSAEMPIQIETWSGGESLSEGLMTAIAKCLSHQHRHKIDHRSSLSILYVGMGKKEQAKWRIIVPLGLERVLDQWRLIAQDISKDDFPVRNYVIPRIIDHKVATEPLPKGFSLRAFNDNQRIVTVELNVNLTRDQEMVIRNEMRIDKSTNQICINERTGLDFLRRFSAAPVSENTVWPVITSIEKNKCM